MLNSPLQVDPVVAEAQQLVCDVVNHKMKNEHLVRHNEVSKCMINEVSRMLEKHEILFRTFPSRLMLTGDITDPVLSVIAEELFRDGVTWSRIISLYALVGRLAESNQPNNDYSVIRHLNAAMTGCIENKIAPFVQKNGGWSKLCEEFCAEEDVTSKVWMFLFGIGAALGLAATLLSKYLPGKPVAVFGSD